MSRAIASSEAVTPDEKWNTVVTGGGQVELDPQKGVTKAKLHIVQPPEKKADFIEIPVSNNTIELTKDGAKRVDAKGRVLSTMTKAQYDKLMKSKRNYRSEGKGTRPLPNEKGFEPGD